ncbi:hypothetical protein CPK_ORF00304 [Chlamydia pneumoniae LPCoLN]|nr:hypothetical protein CPK_ORF00304 [Chlamydia pneumoniae LPCoLN]
MERIVLLNMKKNSQRQRFCRFLAIIGEFFIFVSIPNF